LTELNLWQPSKALIDAVSVASVCERLRELTLNAVNFQEIGEPSINNFLSLLRNVRHLFIEESPRLSQESLNIICMNLSHSLEKLIVDDGVFTSLRPLSRCTKLILLSIDKCSSLERDALRGLRHLKLLVREKKRNVAFFLSPFVLSMSLSSVFLGCVSGIFLFSHSLPLSDGT
jgi:hypothetical protein